MNKIETSNTGISARRQKSIFVFVVLTAVLLLLGGIQSLVFFNMYTPGVALTSTKLQALVSEKYSGELLNGVWELLWKLGASVSQEHEAALQLRTLIKTFNETARVAPKETVENLASGIPELKKNLPEAAEQLAQFESAIEQMREIYTIDFEGLIDDLQNPPFYLWPSAAILVEKSAYLRIATYNRAMYLAQTGEMGTARVLLNGLQAATHDNEFQALVYFGLARLQWQLFAERGQIENYMLGLNFLRQSIQTDPQFLLARRLLDFLLSMEMTSSFEAGQGDPTSPSEGEAGADPEVAPVF